MEEINMKAHLENTNLNIKSAIKRFSKSGTNFKGFEQDRKTNNNKKMATIIGGKQISGSLSPFIHGYSSYLIDKIFNYFLLDLEKEKINIDKIFDYLENNQDIIGANITMPYKIDVFDRLMKSGNINKTAKLVGAVNTLYKIDGKFFGVNTDVCGISNPIQERLGKKLENIKYGYVLGSGGASRAAIVALLKLGIKNIFIFARNQNSLDTIKEHFERNNIKGLNIQTVIYDVSSKDKSNISSHIKNKGIIINTLPFGFKEGIPKYPINQSELKKISNKIVLFFDMVYDLNKKMTPIIENIRKNYSHIEICDGIDMIVEQAKKGFSLWTEGGNINAQLIKKIIRKSSS